MGYTSSASNGEIDLACIRRRAVGMYPVTWDIWCPPTVFRNSLESQCKAHRKTLPIFDRALHGGEDTPCKDGGEPSDEWGLINWLEDTSPHFYTASPVPAVKDSLELIWEHKPLLEEGLALRSPSGAVGANLDNLAALIGIIRKEGETDVELRARVAEEELPLTNVYKPWKVELLGFFKYTTNHTKDH